MKDLVEAHLTLRLCLIINSTNLYQAVVTSYSKYNQAYTAAHGYSVQTDGTMADEGNPVHGKMLLGGNETEKQYRAVRCRLNLKFKILFDS